MLGVTFQQESCESCFQEALPLLFNHWKEIAHFQDIKLEPDFEMYCQVEQTGQLRTYTARAEQGKLIGYAVFFVRTNIHYKSSLQAVQDVIYIDIERRGFGKDFIAWCDMKLREEGVEVVYHHLKSKHNWGPMLERQGYELVDLIYAKDLR